MILTITLNASVDKLYLVESLATGTVTRVREVHNSAGGKGLNVSRVAALAGEKVHAMGFLGGFAGGYVRQMLSTQGIEADFTEIAGETRSCINVRDLTTRKHTELLEPGAAVTPDDLERFLTQYQAALPHCTVAAISGSAPVGTPSDFYARLVTLAKQAGKPVILDASGELLIEGVKALPTMIKPNSDEIAQLLGASISSREELTAAARRLQESGIPIVAVSLGKDGVMVAGEEGVWQGTTPDIPVVNTVGCGDSMVAGFAIGIARGLSLAETIRLASAVSTANALSIRTGWFEQADFERLLTQVDAVKL